MRRYKIRVVAPLKLFCFNYMSFNLHFDFENVLMLHNLPSAQILKKQLKTEISWTNDMILDLYQYFYNKDKVTKLTELKQWLPVSLVNGLEAIQIK